ncbi:hypothetical protein TRFO_09475 [Tritrichomonas foetus]|uniref:Surface antigen BspA-like n=1 Tax=Tritrichomonas foetus TaxID=1144522 RepID=A0A1J4JJP2_9EUKA|nr:hypothetical protein TRFO_09475 [Tritrichomonas foetus]|eukprot:OHS97460.1 hypothetical protein TRFO_09475 [Tritrichomonas foetus]
MLVFLLYLSVSSDVSFEPGRDYVYPSEFNGWTNITDVEIPEGILKIGDSAFLGCTNLVTISFPNSLQHVDVSAFNGCSKLSSVTFIGDFTKLSYNAFFGCSSLVSVTFPKGFNSYQMGAIRGTSKLASINFEEGNQFYCVENGLLMDYDKTYVLFSTTDAVDVVLPSTVKVIYGYAFEYSKSIKSFNSGDNLEQINSAFYGCTCEIVFIGKNVKFIASGTFSKSNVASITIDLDNQYYSAYNNAIFNKNMSLLLFYPDNLLAVSYEIPPNMEEVAESVFQAAENLQEFIVPASNTFFEAVDGILYKGTCLYLAPPYKTNINIRDGTTSLGMCAFDGSIITSIDLPNTITHIGAGAFRLSKIAHMDCSHVTSFDVSVFHMASLVTIILNDNLKMIPNTMFRLSKLVSLTLPKNVEVIDSGAFSSIQSLTTIVFNEGLTTINNEAFSGCANLQDFTFPKSLLYIEFHAFYSCGSITKIVFPENVVYVGIQSFSSSNSLKVVNVTNCFTKIHETAFQYCRYQEELTYCQATDTFTPAVLLQRYTNIAKLLFLAYFLTNGD